MATSKPRVQVTLTDEQYLLIRQYAQLQQVSMSSIVSELVVAAVPAFQLASDMLIASQYIKGKAREQWLASISSDTDKLKEASSSAFISALLASESALGERSPLPACECAQTGGCAGGSVEASLSRSAEGRDPPSTNRGVRSYQSPPNNASVIALNLFKSKENQ